jgi:hypothetical protein
LQSEAAQQTRFACFACLAMQELAKFEIDSRNIVINQVIFPEEGEEAQFGDWRL